MRPHFSPRYTELAPDRFRTSGGDEVAKSLGISRARAPRGHAAPPSRAAGPGRIFRQAWESGAPLCLPRAPTERYGRVILPSDSIAVQSHLSAIPFSRLVSLRVQKADLIAGNAPSP